jgi:hypothetical protein
MAPSQGNIGNQNDTTGRAAMEVGDDTHDSGATPSTIFFPFRFVKSTNESHIEEEISSDYHIWKRGADDNSSQPQRDMNKSFSKDEIRAATIAACFLQDYEDGRHPTLSSTFERISDRQLQIYRFKNSWPWKVFGLSFATILLFARTGQHQACALPLQTVAVLLFGMDLYMKSRLISGKHINAGNQLLQRQLSPSMDCSAERGLTYALVTFTCLHFVQNLLGFCFLVDKPNSSSVHPSNLVLSMFTPIVFFYTSRRARDALIALIRVANKLLRVILIELFLFLTFAAGTVTNPVKSLKYCRSLFTHFSTHMFYCTEVACQLYTDDDNFRTLARSWLSLFACEYD